MNAIVQAALAYLLARIKEPSTWASIAVALVGAFPALKAHVGDVSPYAIAIAAALGVALPETKA